MTFLARTCPNSKGLPTNLKRGQSPVLSYFYKKNEGNEHTSSRYISCNSGPALPSRTCRTQLGHNPNRMLEGLASRTMQTCGTYFTCSTEHQVCICRFTYVVRTRRQVFDIRPRHLPQVCVVAIHEHLSERLCRPREIEQVQRM